MGAPGFEPGTSALSGLRSNQLSYAPVRGETCLFTEVLCRTPWGLSSETSGFSAGGHSNQTSPPDHDRRASDFLFPRIPLVPFSASPTPNTPRQGQLQSLCSNPAPDQARTARGSQLCDSCHVPRVRGKATTRVSRRIRCSRSPRHKSSCAVGEIRDPPGKKRPARVLPLRRDNPRPNR